MNRKKALTILGVIEGYSEDDLKSAYRKKVKEYHPDLNNTCSTDQFLEVQSAYSYLLKNKVDNSIKLTHESIFKIIRV